MQEHGPDDVCLRVYDPSLSEPSTGILTYIFLFLVADKSLRLDFLLLIGVSIKIVCISIWLQ